MAFSIRLTGIAKDGSELFCIEPHWWSIAELHKNIKPKWTVTNDTGSYEDQDTDISIEEARILHEQFKPVLLDLIDFNSKCVESEKTSTDQYAALRLKEYVDYVAALHSHLQTIEAAIGANSAATSHFHLCIFEWESGL